MSERDRTSSTSQPSRWRLPPDGYRSMSLAALREEASRQHDAGFRLAVMFVRDGVAFERAGDGWLFCVPHGMRHHYDALPSLPWRFERLADDPWARVTFFALLEEKPVVSLPMEHAPGSENRATGNRGGHS